jgi:hypothetical protein
MQLDITVGDNVGESIMLAKASLTLAWEQMYKAPERLSSTCASYHPEGAWVLAQSSSVLA